MDSLQAFFEIWPVLVLMALPSLILMALFGAHIAGMRARARRLELAYLDLRALADADPVEVP